MPFISIFLFSIATTGISQKVNKKDSTVIKQIFDTSLTNGASYEWLDYMSNNIGSRLSGSLGAELAVVFTKEQMEELGIDKVYSEVLPHQKAEIIQEIQKQGKIVVFVGDGIWRPGGGEEFQFLRDFNQKTIRRIWNIPCFFKYSL